MSPENQGRSENTGRREGSFNKDRNEGGFKRNDSRPSAPKSDSPWGKRSEEPRISREGKASGGSRPPRDDSRSDRPRGPRSDAPRSDRPKFDGPRRDGSRSDSPRREGGYKERSGGYKDRPSGDSKTPYRSAKPAEEETPPWMKRLLALRTDKGRERENRFLAEGNHCVEEVMTHHKDIIVEFYYLNSLESEPLVAKMKATGKPIHPLTSEQLDLVSNTITSQGVFAVCFCEAVRPDWDKCRLVTLVDAVQDPGNLGALFRTSVGFGMDAMVLGKGTVNAFNPKVVRGSSGTFLRVPFENRVDLAERIQFLRGKGFTIVATSLHTPHTLEALPKMKKKIAILVGNEGAGADSKYVDLADAVLRIPMNGNLESLNVAVAHGILSYQLATLTR